MSGCHDAVSVMGNLNMTATAAYANLVGASASTSFCTNNANSTRVAAGLPDQSCILLRLKASSTADRMPKNENALSADKIDCVKSWIQNGAPNN